MARHATIILDSGAFLHNLDTIGPNPPEVRVGYFHCADTYDIRIYVNGSLYRPPPDLKLAKRIRVEHAGARSGITLTPGFLNDVLRFRDLYGPDSPTFKEADYDSIIQFDTGVFHAGLVKPHLFKEVDVKTGIATSTPKKTSKDIAHDVFVNFQLMAGDVLTLAAGDGVASPLWSTATVPYGKKIEIHVIADCPTADKFYRQALAHRLKTCWVPNPDPPPMGGP